MNWNSKEGPISGIKPGTRKAQVAGFVSDDIVKAEEAYEAAEKAHEGAKHPTDLTAEIAYDKAGRHGKVWYVLFALYTHGRLDEKLEQPARSLGDALTFVGNLAQSERVSSVTIHVNLYALHPLAKREWTTQEILDREA